MDLPDFFPPRFVARFNIVKSAVAFVVKYGGVFAPRECNICGYEGYFYPDGLNLQRDSGCPKCRSMPRHRLLKFWFDTTYPHLGDVLHFAPEKSVTSFIKPAAASYATADLHDISCDLLLDIERLELDRKFDTVIACHVLEHVDDEKAVRSIRKHLNNGGVFIAMVPLAEGVPTYENAAITDPAERQLHFGQWDHVRWFGNDVVDRLSVSGLKVTRFAAPGDIVAKHGLLLGETVFICLN
jgi:SAM-dependent methyltransferase